MNRKWRTNYGAQDTVISYPDFRASLPPRDADYDLADPTDLYAVYTVSAALGAGERTCM